jgi:hypothetical protein
LKVNKTLIEINIRGTHDNQNTKDYANMLMLNNTLRNINFIHSHISDEGIKYIAEALKINNTLEKISIDSDNYSHIGLNILIDSLIYNNKSIIYLDLSNYTGRCDLDVDLSSKLFIKLLKENTILKTLKINHFTDDKQIIYEIISELYNNNILEHIEINNPMKFPIGFDLQLRCDFELYKLIIDILNYNITIKDIILYDYSETIERYEDIFVLNEYIKYTNIIEEKLKINKKGLIVLNISNILLFDEIFELKIEMLSGKQLLFKISIEEELETLLDIIKQELNFYGHIRLILPNNNIINNLDKEILLINLLI